jgi:hypothetical protein
MRLYEKWLIIVSIFLQTRIFVTNAINWLPNCDVVAYMEQGRISEIGSYEELVERDERFGDYIKQCEHEYAEPANQQEKLNKEQSLDREHELSALKRKASQRPPDGNISQSMEGMPPRPRATETAHGEAAHLMQVEQFNAGVTLSAYWDLFKQMSMPMTIVLATGYLVSNTFFLISNLWIVQWCQINVTITEDGVVSSSKSYESGMYALWVILQSKLILALRMTFYSLYLTINYQSIHQSINPSINRSINPLIN